MLGTPHNVLFRLALPLIALITLQSLPASATPCEDQLQLRIQADTQAQNQSYIQLGGGGIRTGNESRLQLGKNGRAVLLLHGFLASPFEVHSVADRLNQIGYTVYSPLIFGFGTSAENANQATVAEQQESVRKGFDELRNCYGDISLVGMSWGAALANDFVLNNPEGADIKSLVLLSPYFKAKQWGAEAINAWTSKYLDVLPAWVAGVTAPNDHRIFKLFPQFHTPGLPILLVLQSLKYCDSLASIDQTKIKAGQPWQSQIPTLVVSTDADETVDAKFGRDYALAHYPNSTFITYPASMGIPHQVPLAEVNPHLPELLDAVVRTIDRH